MVNSISVNSNEFIWEERYRPQKLEDCILPAQMKTLFEQYKSVGEIQNLLLSGPPGIGKTSLAKALCNDMGLDYLLINASEEGGIDTLRTKIKGFASTMSLEGNSHRVVILDEAENLSAATQQAFRAFEEEFSSNCRFILTCNYKNRIIEPLHSRFVNIDYSPKDFKEPVVLNQILRRLSKMLKAEGVTYDKDTLGTLIIQYAPDWRKIINTLQYYVFRSGKKAIEIDVLQSRLEVELKELVNYIQRKDFKNAQRWIFERTDLDSSLIWIKLYEELKQVLEPSIIPNLVLVIADYQYKDAFVVNKQINLLAACTTIMSECVVS